MLWGGNRLDRLTTNRFCGECENNRLACGVTRLM